MKRIIATVCVLVMLMAFLPNVFAAKTYPANADSNEWEVLKTVNRERKKEGLAPLSTFLKAQQVADIRAKECETLFSHTRPNGSSCFTAVFEMDIDCLSLGENIAMGQTSAEIVMESWMDSPGHKQNILTPTYKHVGVGYYHGKDVQTPDYIMRGHYWSQMFIGGCTTTDIEITGELSMDKAAAKNYDGFYLKVTCDMHGACYMPLESAEVSYKNMILTAKYDGKTATVDFSKPNAVPMPDPPIEYGTFKDVPKKEWFYGYVEYAAANGIMGGKGAAKFEPNANITRAEFVQVLANIDGVDTGNKTVDSAFSDIKSGQWFAPAVMWAYNSGIVSGKGAGRFDPNAKITREEMCVMLVNYANFCDLELSEQRPKTEFNDDGKISAWASDAVYKCYCANLVNGKGEGMFDPKGTAIRAEAATIFSLLHQNFLAK